MFRLLLLVLLTGCSLAFGGSRIDTPLGNVATLSRLDAAGNLVTGQSAGPLGLVQRFKAANNEYMSFTFDPLGNLVSRHKQPSALPDTIAIYDTLGGAKSDLSTGSGPRLPRQRPHRRGRTVGTNDRRGSQRHRERLAVGGQPLLRPHRRPLSLARRTLWATVSSSSFPQ